MKEPVLASKKNVIIWGLIFAIILFDVGVYFLNNMRFDKEMAFGAPIEVVAEGDPLSKAEYIFMYDHAEKFSSVVDLALKIPLPKGEFQTGVRIFDELYPLFGVWRIDEDEHNPTFKDANPGRLFGVAVNAKFLEKSGMKMGDIFAMGMHQYQLRGRIIALPDESGEAMNEKPLLLVQELGALGGNMLKNASWRTYRYRIVSNSITPAAFEGEFRKKFPESYGVVNR